MSLKIQICESGIRMREEISDRKGGDLTKYGQRKNSSALWELWIGRGGRGMDHERSYKLGWGGSYSLDQGDLSRLLNKWETRVMSFPFWKYSSGNWVEADWVEGPVLDLSLFAQRLFFSMQLFIFFYFSCSCFYKKENRSLVHCFYWTKLHHTPLTESVIG